MIGIGSPGCSVLAYADHVTVAVHRLASTIVIDASMYIPAWIKEQETARTITGGDSNFDIFSVDYIPVENLPVEIGRLIISSAVLA